MLKNLLQRDKKYLTDRKNNAQKIQNRRLSPKRSFPMRTQKNSTQRTKTQMILSTVISMNKKTKSMEMREISTLKPTKNGKNNTLNPSLRTSTTRRVLKTKKDWKMI